MLRERVSFQDGCGIGLDQFQVGSVDRKNVELEGAIGWVVRVVGQDRRSGPPEPKVKDPVRVRLLKPLEFASALKS